MYTLNAHCYFLNHRPWALTIYSAPLTINICSSCLRNFICLQYPKFSLRLCLPYIHCCFQGYFWSKDLAALKIPCDLDQRLIRLQLIFASSGCLSRLVWNTNKEAGPVSILGNNPLLWTKVVIPWDFLPAIIRCLSEGEKWVWRRW